MEGTPHYGNNLFMNYLRKAPLFVMSCPFQVRRELSHLIYIVFPQIVSAETIRGKTITQEVKASCSHLKKHNLNPHWREKNAHL